MLDLRIASRLGIANKYDHIFRWYFKLKKRINIIYRNNPKVFVIGFNKTGTTTLYYALEEFGYLMSNQHDFERLYSSYLKKEIKIDDVIKRCSYYEVFQDIPFSLPDFYKEIHKMYPKCKFILTVRSTSEVWFNSFEKYYGGKEKLSNDNYIEYGFLYNVFKSVFNSDEFMKEECIEVYESHIEGIKDYFKDAPEQLLILDVSKKNSYNELCFFLKKKPRRENFQWKNKTSYN